MRRQARGPAQRGRPDPSWAPADGYAVARGLPQTLLLMALRGPFLAAFREMGPESTRSQRAADLRGQRQWPLFCVHGKERRRSECPEITPRGGVSLPRRRVRASRSRATAWTARPRSRAVRPHGNTSHVVTVVLWLTCPAPKW